MRAGRKPVGRPLGMPLTIAAVAPAAFWRVLAGRVPLLLEVIANSPARHGVDGRQNLRNYYEMGDLVPRIGPSYQRASFSLGATVSLVSSGGCLTLLPAGRLRGRRRRHGRDEDDDATAIRAVLTTAGPS